jgi:uncharacterized protein (TIGR00290 family)
MPQPSDRSMPASKTLLSWSTGKDAAWALNCLRQDASVELVGLVTTINEAAERVAMHGVRRNLLEAQAAAVGLPLFVLPLPSPCPNQVYEHIMGAFVARQVATGVEAMAFGDLFLQEVRRYRETAFAGSGMRPIFPLWGRATARLARDMLSAGIGAYLSCVDSAQLPARFAGRAFDADLLAELPPDVDPCGENGEFHTFVWGGPMFERPLSVEPGDLVCRDGFVFCDLKPAEPRQGPALEEP